MPSTRRDADLHAREEKIRGQSLAEGHAAEKRNAGIQSGVDELPRAGERFAEKLNLAGINHEVNRGAANQQRG